MATANLTIKANNSVVFKVTVYDQDGTVVDLTPYTTITFSIKNSLKDVLYVLQKTVGSGITVTNAKKGRLEIAITPANTASLNTKADYIYDLQLSDGTHKYTALIGKLILEPVVKTN